MLLVFLGAPGAGKGTQSIKLAEKLNIPHISTGDLLRQSGELQKLKPGELMNDKRMVEIIQERTAYDDCKNGFILDGFPRTLVQAKILDKMLPPTLVIGLDVPEEILIDRVDGRISCPKCGTPYHVRIKKPQIENICDKDGATLIKRTDDTAEVMKRRLEIYKKDTLPVWDFYKDKNVLEIVSGSDIDFTIQIDDIIKKYRR